MTLVAVTLGTAGAAMAFSGVNLIGARNGPDQADPRAGVYLLAVGILLFVACILVS